MTAVLHKRGQREIRTQVSNVGVLRAISPVVSAILRSPIHALLSDSLLVLTFTGARRANATACQSATFLRATCLP
jgi:hypothetical protein